MAPNGKGLELDDVQRFALMKFRRKTSDVCTKPEHDDYFLIRWLRARSWDSDAAEKMLRDSMNWREKWAIDTQLPTWDPPNLLKQYFPSGMTGFDKEGSPVIIVPFAGLDMWGLLHALSKGDFIRMVIKDLEMYLKIAEEQSLKHGPKAKKLVAIMDMEGFSIKQYTWRPAGELVISLLQMYEANYPEILKLCYVINAPKIFAFAFSIVKKFIHEYTLSKIQIYKNEPKKWMAMIAENIEGDQLPKYLGGTLEENGDPRCPSKVRPGGKVPKEAYTRNMNDEQKSNYTNITVKKGEKHVVDLPCPEPGCFLKWEFGLEDHDIQFSITCKDAKGETIILNPKKISGETMETGVIAADGPATYSCVFDNTSSFMRNKKIYYNLTIVEPLKNLTITTLPGEDDAEAK